MGNLTESTAWDDGFFKHRVQSATFLSHLGTLVFYLPHIHSPKIEIVVESDRQSRRLPRFLRRLQSVETRSIWPRVLRYLIHAVRPFPTAIRRKKTLSILLDKNQKDSVETEVRRCLSPVEERVPKRAQAELLMALWHSHEKLSVTLFHFLTLRMNSTLIGDCQMALNVQKLCKCFLFARVQRF